MKKLFPLVLVLASLAIAQAAEPKPAVEQSPATSTSARPDPCAEPKRTDKKAAAPKTPAKQPAGSAKPR